MDFKYPKSKKPTKKDKKKANQKHPAKNKNKSTYNLFLTNKNQSLA